LDLLPTTKTKTKTKPPASSSDGRPSSVSKLDQTAFGSYCLTMDLRLSENTSGSDAAHALGPEAMQEYLFVRIMRLSGSNLRCTQQVFTTNHIHTVFCFHQLQISTTNPIGNLPLLLRTSNPPQQHPQVQLVFECDRYRTTTTTTTTTAAAAATTIHRMERLATRCHPQELEEGRTPTCGGGGP
jgi:hypothetical protein